MFFTSLLLFSLLTASPPVTDALPAGGLESLPVARTAGVPLNNVGFEDGMDSWDSRSQGAFLVAAKDAHGGAAYLRFDATASTPYTPSVRQQVPDAQPGIYTLRFWLKLNGLQPPERGVAGVRVGIDYQLVGGQRGSVNTDVFHGTADWHQVELRALLPKDVAPGSVVVSIHRYNKPPGGEALLDDFTLDRELPPPVEAFLHYPNYRGYLSADGLQVVRLWVRANDTASSEPVRIRVTACETGKQVGTETLPNEPRARIVEFNAADWPLGRYTIRVALGEYEYPPYSVQKISAADRERFDVWFDEDNVLHLLARPVFPLGLYNTVREFAVVDDAEIARLDEMTEAPVNFNLNYTWWPCSTETRRRYLAEMQQRGISYLDTLMPFVPGGVNLAPSSFPIGNELIPESRGRIDTESQCDQFLDRLARAMREMPGHAGWYVMDERPFGRIPSIFHQYQVLRQADPTHPTYDVSNKASELFLWRDSLDVFGMDPYPLMNMKAGRPLSLAAEETRTAIEAVQGSRPVWMVMQFFKGWSTDRWPTQDELRTMSLMAVTEGARGLFYWSFGIRALLWVKDPQEKEGETDRVTILYFGEHRHE